jgi:aspartyl-tRNA(Asn)/glutamyl-tRNA(Gln) amidotransferase subunit A
MSTAESEICYSSIAELGRGYRERRFSPTEVVAAFLRRIDTLDPTLAAYITVVADEASRAAYEAEQRFMAGTQLGPVDGIPYGTKDLYDTAGIRTTGGSRHFIDRVPLADSTVVRKMRAGGAILLGKHSMYEFASGTPAADVPFPPTLNPWNVLRVPGGSSSGSAAAVAAGLCAGAFGSDTGGSIRGPASYCGTVGLKPSAGLVSRAGVLPLSWTLDTVGPMTRTVEDCALLLDATAGHDAADPDSKVSEGTAYAGSIDRTVRALRIGAPLSLVQASPDLDDETWDAYIAAIAEFERMGAKVQDIALEGFEHANVVVQSIITTEAFTYHHRRVREAPEKFGAVFYRRVLHGSILTAEEYVTAQRGRAMLRSALDEVMTSCDLLVLPTMPREAGTPDEESSVSIWDRTNYMRMFNISGQPAISLPCGFTDDGMPIGLQIAGRRSEDATVLAAANAYELAHSWGETRPPI